MGWSIGYDEQWGRDIGYGVPAYCDHPGCHAEIDRGLAYVCGGEPFGGDHGCGLFFCERHRAFWGKAAPVLLCSRCGNKDMPHTPKPDHPRWIAHKLNDPSWAEWRAENPKDVAALEAEAARG